MPATSSHSSQTKWKLCVICQEDKAESLTSPAKSKREDMGSGFSSLADNLTKSHELGLLGTLKLERLDEGHGIEAAMVADNAQYHHTYMQAQLDEGHDIEVALAADNAQYHYTYMQAKLDEGHGIEAALVADNAKYHYMYMQANIQQHKTAKSKRTNTQ